MSAGLPDLQWEVLPAEMRETSEVRVILATHRGAFFVDNAKKIFFFVIQGHFFACQHITESCFTESFTGGLGR